MTDWDAEYRFLETFQVTCKPVVDLLLGVSNSQMTSWDLGLPKSVSKHVSASSTDGLHYC